MLHTPLHSGVRARWWIEAGLIPTARRAGDRVDRLLRGNLHRLRFRWWRLVVDYEYVFDDFGFKEAQLQDMWSNLEIFLHRQPFWVRAIELYSKGGPVNE